MNKKNCPGCNKACILSDFRYNKPYCYECQKKMAREWKAVNKEKVAAYNKTYKVENKDTISEYNSNYNKTHRDEIQKRSSANYLKKYHKDPSFKIAHCLRKRMRHLLSGSKKEDQHALEILGCTINNFKKWLEYCFEGNMTFQNHGEVWHIDHAVPCAKFNLTIDDEVKKCFHWSNIKPMLAKENASKNSRATQLEIFQHEDRLNKFIKTLSEEEALHYTTLNINRLNYIN